MFQSPSLRGSGRFIEALARLRSDSERVSIPFIAGQWSLLVQSPYPLRDVKVSIPFIAGQWSLRAMQALRLAESDEFQSPSLRGSGRFSFTIRILS